MAFFSTAQRSPAPGTATQLLGTIPQQQAAEAQKDKMVQEALQNARVAKLSDSLLGLEDKSEQGVLQWAKFNNVSAPELKILDPILKQAQVDVVTPTTYTEGVDDQGFRYKEDNKGDRTYHPKFVQPSLGSDTDGKWQEDFDKQTGKRILRHSKTGDVKAFPGQGSSETEKVPAWYKEITRYAERSAFADNISPTADQRAYVQSTTNRLMDLTQQFAQQYNITPEEAVPVAMQQFGKEQLWSRDLKKAFPAAKPGGLLGKGNFKETQKMTQQFLNQDIPKHVIGKSLREKGWDEGSIANMITIGENVIPFQRSGLDPSLLRNANLAEGQMFWAGPGNMWKKRGRYLVNLITNEHVDMDEIPR
jgi:hypothetical protein